MELSLLNLPTLTIGLLALIAFAVLAWRRYDWALLTTIALLPSYLIRFKVLGIPSTWLEIMIIVLIIVYGFKNYRLTMANIKQNITKGKVTNRYPFDIEVILWLILGIIAVAMAGWSLGALGIWKAYFLEAIFVYLLFINTLGRNKAWTRVFWAMAISALLLSLVAWYQKFVDMEFLNPIWSHQVVPRVTSVYPYANALGLYLAPIIILLGVYLKSLLKDKGKLYQIVALIVVIIMSLASIIFSRTEGAMLGVLAGSILFFALSSRRGLWLTAVVLALGLVAIVSVPSWRSVAWEKVSLSDLSGEIRQAQWLETKQMLMASPVNFIFGVGLNNYPVRVLPFHQEGIFYNFDKLPYEEFRNNLVNGSYLYKRAYWKPVQIYQYPHNIILNFWTELGILGVALMLWLLARFFYLSLKIYYQHRDVLALGLASAMVTVLVHGLVDVPYFKNDLAVLWWILFAILAVIKLDYDYERSSTKGDR